MSKRKTAQMRNAARRMRAAGFDLLFSIYWPHPMNTKARFRETLRDFMAGEWLDRFMRNQNTPTCAPRPKRRPRRTLDRYRGQLWR